MSYILKKTIFKQVILDCEGNKIHFIKKRTFPFSKPSSPKKYPSGIPCILPLGDVSGVLISVL